MTGKLTVCALLLTSTTLVQDAGAQPYRRAERNAAAADAGRSAYQVRDDARDLARFDATLRAFDDAVVRRDPIGVRGALQSFVAQGRREVAEQRRETAQAAGEARRSGYEVRRDGYNPRDRRDARDDRRDFGKERNELIQEESLLADLERVAAAELNFGPRAGIINNARQIMVRFTQLAAAELQRSRRELREDRRELREDQRGYQRGRYYR